MSLRIKTMLIIGLTLAGFLLILLAASHWIVYSSHARLEQRSVEENVQRAMDALASDVAAMDSVALDWAYWDDTYNFVEDQNEEYAASNLVPESLINLRLNLMAFVHSSGRVVYTFAVDLESEETVPFPPALLAYLAGPGADTLLRHPAPDQGRSGVLLLPEGALLLASRPILTSAEEGPSRGTLLAGRFLNEAEVERLATITHLALTIQPLENAELPAAVQAAQPPLSDGQAIIVHATDAHTVAGYAVLRDLDDRPVLLLRVDSPRSIYDQGRVSLRYFTAFILIIGLALAVAILVLLEREVLRRVAHLSSSVSRIGTSHDLGTRVELAGNDELAGLGRAIDGMLAALDHSNAELRRAHDELEVRVTKRTAELSDANRVLAEEIAERMRIEREIRQRNRELSLLNRVIAVSAAGQEVEAVLAVACEELLSALGAAHAAAVLLDDERVRGDVVAVSPGTTRPLAAVGLPLAENSLWQNLARERGPLVVAGAQADPWCALVHGRAPGCGAVLLLPLLVDGQAVGALSLVSPSPDTFSAEALDLAFRVAHQVSTALARSALQETQRQLGAIVEQTAETVIVTDPDGTIVYVNPAFESATGYSRQEAIGQTPRLLKSGRQGAAVYDDLWRTITAGQVWHGRLINRKKDGSLFTEEGTISPVRGRNGEIAYYVAVKRDVTREVLLEEQFRQAQKMEAMGQLAAGVAHDMGNLLTRVQANAYFLETRLASEPALLEYVEHLTEAVQQAGRLTNHLLSFSRRRVVEPRVLPLNEVVADLDPVIRHLFRANVEVQINLAPDLVAIEADPSQLEQVIMNLVINARDAMPERGRICVETARAVFDPAAAAGQVDIRPGEYAVLRVADTGTGMTDEVKAHLFEPFFTTKERGHGTGLGLATVFGIVKQHGGHIEVTSEPGRGTTFQIYFPAADGATDTAPGAGPSTDEGAG